MPHYVQIVEKKTKKVDTQFACGSKREADFMKSGVEINLNRDCYNVVVSETKSDDCVVSMTAWCRSDLPGPNPGR